MTPSRNSKTLDEWVTASSVPGEDIALLEMLALAARGARARGAALRPVSAEEARTALAEGVQACEVCRPDRVLTP
ncbi:MULTISPECIES: DUF6233 domain-containing protein [Streptomyces]|uniref:DUF6233 domain-containing protein n=1 Tax=Streptomyces TaxID=1883 RepID=UPI00131A5157|nr:MULTISPECIES: DUF6233 domain-containing protein [Streptomyces]MDP9954160.1 hypothetical protein [Streptomyces sp. DSM 41269]